MLRLVGDRARKLRDAVLDYDINPIIPQLATLTQVLGDRIRKVLVRGQRLARREHLPRLDLQAPRLLPRQGEGYPKPCRGSQEVTGTYGHGNILLTIGA